jgi:hypothetical protein
MKLSLPHSPLRFPPSLSPFIRVVKKTPSGKHNKFPHFYRKFTASAVLQAKTALWLLLYTLVLANVFSHRLLTRSMEYVLQQAILKQPFSGDLHTMLGRLYLPYNREMAVRELALGQRYSPVLGMQTGVPSEVETIQAEQKNLENETLLYESITQKDPNYFYAQMKLGNIYYALDKKDQGKLMLAKLEKTIPFHESVMDLQKLYKE